MGNDASTTTTRKSRGRSRRSSGQNVERKSALGHLESMVFDMDENDSHPKSNNSKTKPKMTMQQGVKKLWADRSKLGVSENDTVMVTDALSDVRVNYHVQPKELGHGHYGIVRKCMHRETQEWYAIKSIRKSKVGTIEVLKRETEILKEVNHPNIIRLIEVHEDERYIHLITELCTGGELYDRINAKTQSDEGRFLEQDAAKLVRDILSAIAYCHDVKHIVHRDLKPENFLFLTPAEDAPIKIIDFGLSRHDTTNLGVMKTKVGTHYYVSPEVLNREYTKSCDMWSIGVITYILLCGYPPFYGDSDQQIFDCVLTGHFEFPSPEWDAVSQVAKEFIASLLKKDPTERMTAAQGLKHEWIQTQVAGADAIERRISLARGSGRHETFRKYLAMKKLKKAALSEIATHLTQTEVGSLGEIFQEIDKDEDGLMSLSDLDNALACGNFSSALKDALVDLREELKLSGEDTMDWKDFLVGTMDKNLAMREDKIRMAFDHFRHTDESYILMSDLVDIFCGEVQAREIMGFVDSDGDDRVTFEDFQKAMEESMHNKTTEVMRT